jgi:hypothetical protein
VVAGGLRCGSVPAKGIVVVTRRSTGAALSGEEVEQQRRGEGSGTTRGRAANAATPLAPAVLCLAAMCDWAEENESIEDGEADKERNIGVLFSSPVNPSAPGSPRERTLAGGCDAWRVAPARLPRGGRGVRPGVGRRVHGPSTSPQRRLQCVRTPECHEGATWAAQPGPACATGAATLATMHDLFCEPVFKNQKLPKTSTKSKISKNRSCRGAIDLQLSQRATYVFINGLSGNVGRSCRFSTARVTVHSAVKPIFVQFAHKIGMSANYEKCVPGNNEQLSYWPILNFYSEFWRMRKKTISALKEI